MFTFAKIHVSLGLFLIFVCPWYIALKYKKMLLIVQIKVCVYVQEVKSVGSGGYGIM